MTNEQFDTLVRLIQTLAYRATGDAIHQRRAGREEDDIEEARCILVEEDIDDGLDEEWARARLGPDADNQ